MSVFRPLNRSRPTLRSRWVVLMFLAGAASSSAAQTVNFDALKSSASVNSDAKPSEAAAQLAGYASGGTYSGSGNGDVQMQLAGLQSQIASQNSELASMRRELRSPLAGRGLASDPRWFGGAETVIVQPIQSNNSALIVQMEPIVATIPAGYQTVTFPWELAISPRVYFGRESNDESLGWRMRYWQFRHTESFAANHANGIIPTGTDGYVGYLSESGNVRTGAEFITDGEFFSGVRADVIDMEIQRMLLKNVDIYAGLRYAKLSQTYFANTDDADVDAASEFRGIGPTIALRMQHPLPLNRLTLYADARGSMLFGQQDYRVVDSLDEDSLQVLNGVDLRSYDDSVNAFSTNAEMQLGIRYDVSSCLNLHIGLEAQHFSDVGGPNPIAVFTNIDGGYATDSPLDDHLSFVGLAFGAELAW